MAIKDYSKDNRDFVFITDLKTKFVKNCVLSLERFLIEDKELLKNLNVGVLLKIDDEVNSLADYLPSINLIVVDFSDFENGISYSKVRILRSTHNYTKEIFALNAHIDQLQLIIRSGVDSFKLADEYKSMQAKEYSNINSICYQESSNNYGLVERF